MEAIARDFPLLKNWWTFVVRGAFAVIAGILALTRPRITLAALLLTFAVYAIASGVLALLGAVRGIRTENRAVYLLFEGLLGIGAGILALVAPGITALALLYVIAF